MHDPTLVQTVQQICSQDSRYHPDAYCFVLDALDFTVRLFKKNLKDGQDRHVTGKELLEGTRLFALQEFGPMAHTVLNAWGVHCTRDFGEIVFNLVEFGKLRKTEQDRREDFDDGYDFHAAFVEPFLPKSRPRAQRQRQRRKPRRTRTVPPPGPDAAPRP